MKRNLFIIQWEYLPVLDNQPDDKFQYCLSIFTAIKSSRHLTCTVYLKITGENGSTSERIVKTNSREDFRSGTCCDFLLTTEEHLGKLESLTLWHDNKGKSPDWKLSKVVVIDLYTKERFLFLCGEWLSMKYDDVKTFRTLVPITPEIINGEMVFTELSLRGFFDDHLWISLSKRPNYSRFSRVQRLWSLVALLFLSMVASAMWYNSEPTEEDQLASGNAQQSVELGPVRFNLKQIYVGLMSSLITVIPSVIIISLFRNRNLKSESKTTKRENMENKEKKNYQCRLPWWTIFIAYSIVFSAIAAGAFFTFLYSLQFGSEKTNDWLLSFVFGTFEGAFMMEPLKVLLLASILGLCCKSSTDTFLECAGETHVHKVSYVDTIQRQDLIYYPCPNAEPDIEKLNKQRRVVQLDKKLKSFGISWIKSTLYILLLAIVCAHNTITEAFRQNEYMKGSVKDTFLANTTDDIYVWIETYFIPNVWPKWYENQALRTAYEQRFMYDQYSYRISDSILRQVRSGNCSTIEEMTNAVPRCIEDYKSENEDSALYCKGWIPQISSNENCSDEYDPIDKSFVYRTAEELRSMVYIGELAVYGGGGYMIDLGPKQSLVNQYISQLRNLSWIDGYTRAVFIETNTFNANTRLFTHLKIVFELSEYGSIFMKTTAESLNLYPYVTSMDYIVLACQFIFVIVVIVRLVFFAIHVFKTRHTCMASFSSWVTAIDIIMCLSAIVFYILRIDSTIKTVDDIIENKGSYVSFEYVEMYDLVYKTAFGLVFFFGVLEFLQPLTMNYHFFILQKSLLRARYDLFMSLFLMTLAIVSFGSYLYLSLGKHADNFKDLYSSIITLLRMLLAMIAFRLNSSLNSTEGRIATSLFFFTISIIGINLFIAILFSHFADVQAMQKKHMSETREKSYLNSPESEKTTDKSEDVFDNELNQHVWKQLDRITHIFLERQVHAESFPQSFPEDVLQKLDILDQHIKLKCHDEYRFMKVLACMLYLTKTLRWNMKMALDVTADYSKNTGMKYKFFCAFLKNPRLTIYFPDASLSEAPEIQCSCLAHRCYPLPSEIKDLLEFAKTRIYELKIQNDRSFQMKVNDITKRKTIVEFEDDFITVKDYLICSFDDRQSWYRYALRPRNEKLSCVLPKLPTHCFVTGRQGNTIVKEQTLSYFPDIEIHQIRKESCSIYMQADKRIRMSFPPECVDDNCELYLMMDLPERQICPFIHVYITKSTGRPVEISLPIVYQGSKNTENLIITREGNGKWMTLNSVLKLDAAGYTFETSIIKSNVPTAFGIKEVVLPWVENGFDRWDSKLIKAINMVSRYNSVAAKWKDIANSLDIEIPAIFNDEETDSYEIVCLPECSEKQRTEEKKFTLNRITDIPISAQEKSLYIMAEWCRLFPRGLVVSSLKKVLEDCNLHYIAEKLYERL